MGEQLASDKLRATVAVLSAATALLFPSSWGQMLAISAGGILGLVFPGNPTVLPNSPIRIKTGRITGIWLLTIFFVLLFVLPFAATASGSHPLRLFDSYHRAGALVFGGGHVVPGSLFTFAAYLGAVSS